MPYVCFTLQVRPDKVAEYRRRHAEVWPEMLQALWNAGWHDYRLYLRDDGLVVGHFQTEDFEASLQSMDALDVNRRWQVEMSSLVETQGDVRVDEALRPLEPIFTLVSAPVAPDPDASA